MHRLVAALVVTSWTLAGCEQPEPYCESADSLFGNCPEDESWGAGGGGGSGGSGGTYARPPEFAKSYAPYADYCDVCPIAVGGTSMLHVLTNDAINPYVQFSGGVLIATAIDIRDREEAYALTTMNIEGDTIITMSSANYPTLERVVPVRHVRDVFVEGDDSYEPSTPNPALRNGMPVSIRLLGEPTEPPLRPQYLVDATLSVSDPRMSENAWDRYTLATTTGSHVVEVTSDSIGPRLLAFDTMDAPSSLEAVVRGTPAAGGTTRVCFHGYREGREVISTVAIDNPSSDNAVRVSPSNCATVTWQGIARKTLTARAHGLVKTVELALP